MLFGPLRCEGVGISDGETIERDCGPIYVALENDEEMRPAHRRDVLAHVLACYGKRSSVCICDIIAVFSQKLSGIVGGCALGGVNHIRPLNLNTIVIAHA